MRDISTVMEQLRVVRSARQKFLGLWALEKQVIHPGLDRVAADLDALATSRGRKRSPSMLNDPQSAADE